MLYFVSNTQEKLAQECVSDMQASCASRHLEQVSWVCVRSITDDFS